MDTIHIITAVNNNFSKHMAVMLFSLLENKKSKNSLIFHVLETDLSEQNKLKLRRLVSRYRAEISFIKMDESLIDHYLISGHISKETYFRINIPELIDQKIHKVLYLDSDMIIHDDITRLWEININEAFLAAVEDPMGHYRIADLAITEDSYFNAGVLLINVTKWRKHAISDQVMRFLIENPSKIWWWDQDALNAILFDKWVKLDMKWNYQPLSQIPLQYPSIVHFTSPMKPWNGDPPLKEYYFYYSNKLKW
ncbi:glycosyltransferase family 8 protein [Neobacillus drentensis]|uniref:glycosyltransferase family 8 protein n=1 Tax=Neobacillus drentensis TaxID=220684 RepID=UPI002863DB0E|nr:glycosyltransferase family 8 protein [Neobacillus drentensis]MDR7240806.1 lipopolysaccharide biosynthesis glycosyltransferase [Neobacillus drentensis]